MSYRDNCSLKNVVQNEHVTEIRRGGSTPDVSKNSTDEGRMISIKPVPRNAFFPIRDNLGPDSNGTEESDLR
jgi:hypothetical protein